MPASGIHRPTVTDQLARIVPHVPVPTRSCNQLLVVEESRPMTDQQGTRVFEDRRVHTCGWEPRGTVR